MSFNDKLTEEAQLLEKADLVKARRERDIATSEVNRLREQLDQANRALSIIERVESSDLEPPKWLTPAKPKNSAATLLLMLSDTHFDEVVNPAEMEGLNAYNRDIAVQRLNRWATNTVNIARHYLAGVTYDGVVLMLGGDIFSGDIHEELAETNEDSMIGSVLFWSEQVAAAVDILASEFGKVHVPVVIGNHGRTTRKPRMKLRAKTNFDWLLGKMVEKHFTGDKRVTFQIPEATDALIKIYDWNHLLTHGDQVSGGGGIGGIYPPIMRMRARKAQRYLTTGQDFSTLWIGHWHQYLPSPHLVVNGSLKGYDEYAFVNNFQFEPPQQALAVVTPKHNITFHAPIFSLDRKKEGW
jgi:hypothetical protein